MNEVTNNTRPESSASTQLFSRGTISISEFTRTGVAQAAGCANDMVVSVGKVPHEGCRSGRVPSLRSL